VIKKLVLGLLGLVLLLVLLGVAAAFLIDPDDYREQIAQRASDTLGREVRLDGPMSLTLFPWLALKIEDVQVGNPAALADAPPLASVGTATASIRVLPMLRGQVETGALTLSDARLTIVTAADGQTNLDGLMAEADPAAASQPVDLSGLTLGAITLEDVELVQLDLGSGTRTTLTIEEMQLAAFQADQAVDFSLMARLSDDSGDLLTIDELSGAVTVAADLGTVRVTDLEADYRLPGSDISGQASASLELQRDAETRLTVHALTTELDAAGQSLGLTLTDSLSLTLGEALDLALTNARVTLNDQSLQASGRVQLGDQLRADLVVAGERLDLRPLIAASMVDPAVDPAGPTESVPADFSALSSLVLNLRLNLDRLIVSDQLRLSQVVAEARLAGGRLSMAPMQAQLLGGEFNGRVDVDFTARPPRVALQPELSGVAIDQLAALSGSGAPLSGLADAGLTLSFSGLDLQSILASLNGSGRLEIANGALEGVDLQQLIDEELTVSNLSNVSRAFGGRTEFERLQTQVDVVDGVVELPDLVLSAVGFGVQGQGRIDFAADRIDYRLQLDLGPDLTERLPSRLRSATGGRIPLTVSGPLAQPVVGVDFASVLEATLRQEITERLFAPREDEAASAPDEEEMPQGESTPDSSEAAADTAADNDAAAESPPRTRERTSQALLRRLLERADDSAEERAEGETRSGETDEASEPPP
jgi:AsmA protein